MDGQRRKERSLHGGTAGPWSFASWRGVESCKRDREKLHASGPGGPGSTPLHLWLCAPFALGSEELGPTARPFYARSGSTPHHRACSSLPVPNYSCPFLAAQEKYEYAQWRLSAMQMQDTQQRLHHAIRVATNARSMLSAKSALKAAGFYR